MSYPISAEKLKGDALIIPSSPIDERPQPTPSRFNPRTWGWKTWAVVIVTTICIIVGAVVGGILGARANAYPNYSKLTYKLQDTYAGDDFFDNFNYYNTYDPANGFVHYDSLSDATSRNLTYVSTTNESAILRVDTSETDATTGRHSVRITSKNTYSSGLFIFDVLHSPYGCATWPALWLSDPDNWPTNGEIDVMEAVNMADTGNQITLHTSEGCKIGKDRKRKETGSAISYDCWNATDSNEGCGVKGAVDTYGKKFNSNGGGVYAMELRSAGIRVWFHPRDSIPSDLSSFISSSSNTSASNASPDPSSWGTALADFPNLECDISSHFKNQSIIADIDICGDWAGQTSVFDSGSCSGTCESWATTNATSFSEAYWEFGGWWVFSAE